MLTDYVQHCHSPCHLEGIKPDTLAQPSLVYCWAFQRNEICTQCNHHWNEHLHVLAELEEYETTVEDLGIKQQLALHASDLLLKQAAITARERLIKEYQAEHDAIKIAAAKFGIWLRENSITPYNDATLAYLDVLIRQEEAKANQGYNNDMLLSLQADYQKHKELVSVLESSMNSNDGYKALDPKGVAELVKELYQLKHFGKMLENVKLSLAAAHEGTYRERPHHVHSNKSTSSIWNPFSSVWGKSTPRHSSHSNGQARSAQSNKSNQTRGFATGSMRPNSQHMAGWQQPQQMVMRNNPSQGNARHSIVNGPAPRQHGVPQQGMPGEFPQQRENNGSGQGGIVRQNTLPKNGSIMSSKSTFSMPSLNPFKKN